MLSYLSLSAISYIFGVYAFDFLGESQDILAVTSLLFLILILVIKKYRKYIFFGALFLALGVIGADYFSNPDHNPLSPLEGKYATFEGYVAETPVKYDDLYQFKLKVTSASYLGKEYKPGDVIRVSTTKAINFGDSLKICGFLEEIPERLNSTDFNSKRYYKSRGIFYKVYAREVQFLNQKPHTYSISYLGNFIKDKLQKEIDKSFSGDDSAILKAITTGNKRQFSSDFQGLLLSSGVMKFFYPSFLHIYIISAMAAFFFKVFTKGKRDIILSVFLLLYASFNSHSPVFLKNSLMVIVALFFLRRRGYTFHSDILSVTILAILLTNPLYAFDVGFVISIASGIMFYYFKDILSEILSFIPWHRLRRFLVFYIITTFGLLPIICYYFNGVSILTNLLSPLYAVIVTMLLFLTPLMCFFTAQFGTALFIKPIISGLLWFFKDLPAIIDRVPFSKIFLGAPSITVILAFFITLYVIYQLYHKDIRKTINISACIVAATLWGTCAYCHITSLGNMDITFVNVGQGDAVVIDIKGGETVLLDGGGKYDFSDYDLGEKVFIPYLADNGHFNIEKAIITHYHSDHCLGIIHAIKTFNVEEIIMPDSSFENPYRLEIERLAKDKNIPITYAKAGDSFVLKEGASLTVLSPTDTELTEGDENEASLVIKLEYNGFSALFTGDISTKTEEKIADTAGDLDVLKISHHGSAGSNSPIFAKAISPEFAIASVGEDNIYGFPKPEAVYNYQQNGAKVMTTAKNGDITVRVTKDGSYRVFTNK